MQKFRQFEQGSSLIYTLKKIKQDVIVQTTTKNLIQFQLQNTQNTATFQRTLGHTVTAVHPTLTAPF